MLYAIPGGVPQHMLRSSMCSTSSPINQEPSETSSLAYLCNMGLKICKCTNRFREKELYKNYVYLNWEFILVDRDVGG